MAAQRLVLVASVLLACALLAPRIAQAGDRERIFLIFGGGEAETLEAEAAKFRSTVLEARRFEFAGTQEMEAIYSECNEATGTSADTRRDCQLRAANRIAVTQILELSGRKLDEGQFELLIEVWSPESNGLLWSSLKEIDADSLARAARKGYPQLAEGYLCWRGVEEACPPGQRTATVTPVEPEPEPEPTNPTVALPKLPNPPPQETPRANPAPKRTSGSDGEDRDGDGAPDLIDMCPDVPEDWDGFDDNDGCPDPDNDLDGTLDAMDACPNEPEDRDAFQDDDGCPDLDNDQDGLADVDDQCPNEPELVNGVQDTDGCPDGGRVVVQHSTIEFLPLRPKFKFDKAELVDAAVPELDDVAAVMLANPDARFEVSVHTDSRGKDSYNLKLSQQRADAVRDYLIAKGVPASQLTAVGYGEDQPIDSNDTENGRANNRRVEIKMLR